MSCINDDLWQFSDGDFADLVDPRDEVLATLDYSHPDPVDIPFMVSACFDTPNGIDQLAVAELIEHQFVREQTNGELGLTEAGCDQVRSRLLKRATWAGYAVRPDARPNPPIGRRLAIAIIQYRDWKDDYLARRYRELGDLIPGLYKNEQRFWILESDPNSRGDR